MAKFIENGAVELYHDNEKMFQTNSDGATFFDSDNNFNLYFECNGTTRGYLFVDATNGGKMAFMDSQDHPLLEATKNGAVDLYYDNSKMLETHDDGVVLNGLNQATVAHGQYDNLVLGNAGGNAGLTIVSGTNNAGTVAWADGSSGAGQYRAYLEYYHDTERMHIAVNTSVAMEWRTDSVICHEHFLPSSDNSYNLGGTSNRWANIYTTDLQLSNEGKSNSVDGTWGDYTIQEGESDLFLINNRSGKKYKFN